MTATEIVESLMDTQQEIEDIAFFSFYIAVTTTLFIASGYLLLRRGNAIAPDVTSSLPLRRWAAALFFFFALGHVWWLLLCVCPLFPDPVVSGAIAMGLDNLTFPPVVMGTLLTMLQDRRRPLWLLAFVVVPVILMFIAAIATHSALLVLLMSAYTFVFGLFFTIYMVHAVRQYGRWLHDNYADLEHKEVWQTLLVLVLFLFFFFLYAICIDYGLIQYLIQVVNLLFVVFLLWRVETLQQLTVQSEAAPGEVNKGEAGAKAVTVPSNIAPLLAIHCEDAQFYLQHDLTLSQLAELIGTNRYYLSQHFVQQGLTYNAYINGLRIEHFLRLYREAVAAHRFFSAQQLAYESGFRSYSTFSSAFKQRMGQTVTAWMRGSAG